MTTMAMVAMVAMTEMVQDDAGDDGNGDGDDGKNDGDGHDGNDVDGGRRRLGMAVLDKIEQDVARHCHAVRHGVAWHSTTHVTAELSPPAPKSSL